MKDYKAIYGSEPAWDLQRNKQEEFADERDERLRAQDEMNNYREAMADDDDE